MKVNSKKIITSLLFGTTFLFSYTSFASPLDANDNDTKLEKKDNKKDSEEKDKDSKNKKENITNVNQANNEKMKKSLINPDPSDGVNMNDTDNSQLDDEYEVDINNPEYKKIINRRKATLDLSNQLQAEENSASLDSQYNERYPLPPSSIIDMRKKDQELNKAKSIRIGAPVKETFSTVNLEPDQQTPIEIKVVPGYISTLTFFDSTGSPWPVEYAKPGDKSFSFTLVGKSGNILNIDTSKLYADSNASIGLVGMDTNFTITLVANDTENTTKKSFRIADRGPKAKNDVIMGDDTVDNAPNEMFDIINGRLDSLKNIKPLKVNGVQADAYSYNKFTYIVSKYKMLSPARENSMSLPNGKTIYKIYPTSSLTFSVDGKMIFANVENEISRN